MSIPTVVPSTPTTGPLNLEPLQELKIKGFGSCNDTPSSGTASLPTPDGANVPLANSAVVEDPTLGDLGTTPTDWPYDYNPDVLQVPGAPLLKDMDSFTDGTEEGSFQYLPNAETDEHGNPLYPLSTARVSLVSEHQDRVAFVLEWLQRVEPIPSSTTPLSAPPTCSATTATKFLPHLVTATSDLVHVPPHAHDHPTPTLKRPRSMTEYEEYRPRRPRTRSCPSSRRSNSMAPD